MHICVSINFILQDIRKIRSILFAEIINQLPLLMSFILNYFFLLQLESRKSSVETCVRLETLRVFFCFLGSVLVVIFQFEYTRRKANSHHWLKDTKQTAIIIYKTQTSPRNSLNLKYGGKIQNDSNLSTHRYKGQHSHHKQVIITRNRADTTTYYSQTDSTFRCSILLMIQLDYRFFTSFCNFANKSLKFDKLHIYGCNLLPTYRCLTYSRNNYKRSWFTMVETMLTHASLHNTENQPKYHTQ